MYYDLITQLITKVKIYESEMPDSHQSLHAFSHWLVTGNNCEPELTYAEPDWAGKLNGRSADSVINTSLVHLYRYARIHAKAAIVNSMFATPDEFIYLISLVAFGRMSKSALIKMNIHDKSAGMQIINRLIANGLAEQSALSSDKRNRMISITPLGTKALEESMGNIRKATRNVTEPLSYPEKMELIRLLSKLEDFHELRMATPS